MKALTLYFKLLFKYRTPFILLLDRHYKPISEDDLWACVKEVEGLRYIPEYRDCDNFAFMLKGKADLVSNAVGIAIGQGHCWNVVLSSWGLCMIEPQNGTIVTNYRPTIIIM